MAHTATFRHAPAKSTDRVQRVQAVFGLTQGELAQILELSPKTLARRALNANETDRLQILEHLASLATNLVPKAHIPRWFSEPKTYLEGSPPKSLLSTESGRRTLESYLLSLIDSNVL
ncbi:MAG: antitoxin Xre-like helix-turn-helix domain-containing protein [Thermoanaerobaculia bacterium]